MIFRNDILIVKKFEFNITNIVLVAQKSLIWRAWANVAWDSVSVVGLYFNFTIVKMLELQLETFIFHCNNNVTLKKNYQSFIVSQSMLF